VAKQTKDETRIEKNPLSIALGTFFARERNLLRDNSKEMANKIGIGESFYRMIEAGSANLHPSRVLQVIKAFPNSSINLDALCKFLVAIQMVESNLSTYETFRQAINDLVAADNKIQKLFKVFEPVWKVMQNGNYEVKDLFDTDMVYNELREFMTNYEYYATSSIETSEVKLQNINTIFENLPTIYFDYVEDFVQRTQELPTRIRFSDLWKWEDKNRKNFKSQYCISRDHENVTSLENLRRYKYRYLWENQYIETNMIFLTDEPVDKIRKRFETNLRKSLTESNDIEKLNDFDERILKVHFKTCPVDNAEVIQALSGMDLDASEESEQMRMYDAVWVFTLVNNNNIGFLSIISKDDVKLVEGVNLNHSKTIEKLDIMKKLWESIAS
jgi:hypothetical protein